MPRLKILVADDEKEARELILHYLQHSKDNVEVKQCADGITTLKSLADFQPDILFLDIKMPELNGLEVLQKNNQGNCPLLFLPRPVMIMPCLLLILKPLIIY
jgi:two-component system LytT family response regulator